MHFVENFLGGYNVIEEDEKLLDELIAILVSEYKRQIPIKINTVSKKNVFRALMNVREPSPLNNRFLVLQDEYLQKETLKKGIIVPKDIPTLEDLPGYNHPNGNIVSLWQGDITRLMVDGIVNAANNQMLGCFFPGHECIDNVIHSAAGLELRSECNLYMQTKREGNSNYFEPTGSVMMTEAYNLPCKNVLHTVGPIVYLRLSEEHKKDLVSSYESILNKSVEAGLRSIALCCISTGEYRFPNEEAAVIAIDTVNRFLLNHPNRFDRIIFNVFKDIDKEIYRAKLLEK